MPRRNKTPKLSRQLPPAGACRDKRRYRSRTEAEAAIADRARLIADDVNLDTYRCPHCQGWHLTSVK